ncbi:hypothetical protein [Halopseudomonas oceani]|uniref:hypothetical protein n=1 Tax=Halopseudomonas oceani TaxID=1708783 RepID=UPI002AA62103|nr:hypothetical protein [Halopseudomonas oceani]
MTENQYQYLTKTVKEKARREGLAALFVPEWMPTENAKQANSMLVSLAGELHQRAQEMTQDFLCHFPECHSGLVLKELVALAFPQPGKEPVELRCERNQEAASELEKRAKPQQSKRSRPASNIAIYCDAEFEALCF